MIPVSRRAALLGGGLGREARLEIVEHLPAVFVRHGLHIVLADHPGPTQVFPRVFDVRLGIEQA